MFGDPEVLPVKVIWDYTYYWGILCQLFFQRRLTDLKSISRLSDALQGSRALNFAIQAFMREWSRIGPKRNANVMLDQASLPWFAELNRGLRDELDEEAFRTRVQANAALLKQLARQIVERACEQCPTLDASAVLTLIDGTAIEPAGRLLFSEAA